MDFNNRRFWRRPEPLVRDDGNGERNGNNTQRNVGSLYGADNKRDGEMVGSMYRDGKMGTTTDTRTPSNSTYNQQQRDNKEVGSLYDNKITVWL